MKSSWQLIFRAIVFFALFSAQVPAAHGSGLQFIDRTAEAGLSYALGPSHGLSWGDFNGDNFQDLHISDHYGTPSLYLNSGNGAFQDITLSSGVYISGDHHGASWADFDNDGDLDLYQALGADHGNGTKSNYLLRNDGDHFTDMAGTAGVQDPKGRGRTPVWFDCDKDGFLDLFIANQERLDAPSLLFRNEGNGMFSDVTLGAGLAGIERAIGAYVADINNDGSPDLLLSSSERGISLFLNNGNGSFKNITAETGLSKTYSVKDLALGDYDNDGLIDIFAVRSGISDYYGIIDNSLRYQLKSKDIEKGLDLDISGSSSAEFILYYGNIKVPTGKIYIGSGKYHPAQMPFSLDPASPENHGEPARTETGVYIWHDSLTHKWQIRYFRKIPSPEPVIISGMISSPGQFGNVYPRAFETDMRAFKNRLFRNLDGTHFADVTDSTGLGSDPDSARSAVAEDFDNDGDIDFYVVYTKGLYNLPNRLYLNDGIGYFIDVAAEAGAQALVQGRGESVAFADYNNDGFLDIMVLNGLGNGYGLPPQLLGERVLLENQGTLNNWIQLKLVGSASNRDAVGASVKLEAGALSLSRQQTGGMHTFSQNSQVLQFGLGSETNVDRITVTWPGGIVQELSNLPVNQRLVIKEPGVSP